MPSIIVVASQAVYPTSYKTKVEEAGILGEGGLETADCLPGLPQQWSLAQSEDPLITTCRHVLTGLPANPGDAYLRRSEQILWTATLCVSQEQANLQNE
jgi:hypothetical protein